MAQWRPHSKYGGVDPYQPRAAAVCDDCGQIYPHHQLKKQMQWFGIALSWTGFLVCYRCLDVPTIQLKTIVLPPDPIPILNPRVEPFTQDEQQGTIPVDNWDVPGAVFDNGETNWDGGE